MRAASSSTRARADAGSGCIGRNLPRATTRPEPPAPAGRAVRAGPWGISCAGARRIRACGAPMVEGIPARAFAHRLEVMPHHLDAQGHASNVAILGWLIDAAV